MESGTRTKTTLSRGEPCVCSGSSIAEHLAPAGLFVSLHSPGRPGGLCAGALLGCCSLRSSSTPMAHMGLQRYNPESGDRDLGAKNCSEVHSVGMHSLGRSKSGVSILHFTPPGSILTAFALLCCSSSPAPSRRPRAHTPARGLKMLHEIPALPRTSGES